MDSEVHTEQRAARGALTTTWGRGVAGDAILGPGNVAVLPFSRPYSSLLCPAAEAGAAKGPRAGKLGRSCIAQPRRRVLSVRGGSEILSRMDGYGLPCLQMYERTGVAGKTGSLAKRMVRTVYLVRSEDVEVVLQRNLVATSLSPNPYTAECMGCPARDYLLAVN